MKFLLITPTLFLGVLLALAPAQSPASPKPPVGVPGDAKLFNGKWYRIFLEEVTWHRAREKCAMLGGQLAVVPDSASWEFVKTLSPASLWLGATDEATEGVWKWIDGTPFTFTAWLPENPNNRGGKEHYLQTLKFKNEHGWNDIDKDGKIENRKVVGFICEWRPK